MSKVKIYNSLSSDFKYLDHFESDVLESEDESWSRHRWPMCSNRRSKLKESEMFNTFYLNFIICNIVSMFRSYRTAKLIKTSFWSKLKEFETFSIFIETFIICNIVSLFRSYRTTKLIKTGLTYNLKPKLLCPNIMFETFSTFYIVILVDNYSWQHPLQFQYITPKGKKIDRSEASIKSYANTTCIILLDYAVSNKKILLDYVV
jgi:hypothetical protein